MNFPLSELITKAVLGEKVFTAISPKFGKRYFDDVYPTPTERSTAT